ncbi:hypothetical protein [Notoacmeibacter marinus]|uniref:hypothetical protein n=1 Tax=Notoacmeibacter marinus TaxID=1876515 RepID=UPI000DF31B06|nr:hypothetical protein [Notoacmeibacter marinus]
MTIGDLERRLLEFDGKAVSILSEAQAACRDQPSYLNDLVDLCFDPRQPVSDSATWILKAELDDGTELPPAVTTQIAESLDEIRPWQAALRLCKSVDMLRLTPAQARRFLKWARLYESHSRPFLRA